MIFEKIKSLFFIGLSKNATYESGYIEKQSLEYLRMLFYP
jgi:hypothetical protein